MKNNIPNLPGVYQFLDQKDAILYIGKAKNLRKRISSYFHNLTAQESKMQNMLSQASSIRIIPLSSEFEALILEANLINKHQPKYNSIFKDDKHYIYIKITKEIFPRIVLARKLDNQDYFFGPFPSTRTVKEVLKFLRTIFPYCDQSRRYKKACLYTHLRLCNPCPGNIVTLKGKEADIAKKQYQVNIRHIRHILSGKINKVRTYIQRKMIIHSDRLDYEKAAAFRNCLQKLNYLTANYHPSFLNLNDYLWGESSWQQEKKELMEILRQFFPRMIDLGKIECYDVSNISGKYAAGALVAFIKGQPEKKLYRRFKIHLNGKPNDFAMLGEIIKRRLMHPEWILPELIVLDGGKPQLSAILKILADRGISIPVIALSKKEEEIIVSNENRFKEIILPRRSYALRLIQRLRDESHRFAHKYHTLLRLKYLLKEG